MAQRSQHSLAKVPPLESGRICFKVVGDTKKGDPCAKQLLINGNVTFSMSFVDEPDDRTVYEAYLTQLRAQQPMEQYMLKNLNSEQLGIVQDWLIEKSQEYQQRFGEEASDIVSLLTQDIALATGIATYEPTEIQMVEMLYQMAQSLDRRDAGKAAKKLRMAGNFIPLKG